MSAGDMYNEGFDAGKREAAKELQPLVDAISDAIFMFNETRRGSSAVGGPASIAVKPKAVMPGLRSFLSPPTPPEGDQN